MKQLARNARLGRYQQLDVIGEGAYGVVYKALDNATGEHLALKELRHVDATSLARFKLEFRTVQEVHHPNLVRLDQLFEEDGTWLIAMELVPGCDLLDHVYAEDSPVGYDETLLRAAFRQLADGLIALHTAGLLHRDLKPTNVRVTPAGRVVLLDFGLTAALDDELHSSLVDALGTIAYMAPEQTLGHKLGPASDWYAFGVCLYEALTGFRPFDAASVEALLQAKRSTVPEPPSVLAPGIAPDLDALCTRLLSVDPEQRPSAGEIRRALGSGRSSPASRPAAHAGATTLTSHFEGRMHELAELGQALERVRGGKHQLVLIEGESGIGKSALIARFLRAHSEDVADGGGYVLRSRCYENEMLACKAFDGAVEGIGRILSGLDEPACRQLLPPRAALLCRLFPALAALPQLSAQPVQGLAADPTVQRLQAFSVFRRLLGRLGENGLLVISIEDLQWADAESFSLLRALIDSPEPVRCLILATVRPQNELEGVAAEALPALRALPGVSTLPLQGLAISDAWRLVRELVPPAVPEPWLETIVRESAGHPLFMSVLARFAARNPDGAALNLTLDAAIAGELDLLSAQARSLVDATAAAGGPIAPPLCGRVAGLDESQLGPLLADLYNAKVLRRRSRGDVACFHDRIRTVAHASLSKERARSLHAQLAFVLGEQPGTDPAVLARHHEAAGQHALAYEHFERAAEQASAALTFARAAVLYARALEVAAQLQLPQERTVALRSARGAALARSGRSTDAAHEYLQAAQHASGEARMRLRVLATQHLLQSAQVKEGFASARVVLEELDLPLAANGASALTRVAWDRTVMRVSSALTSLRPRSSAEGPAARRSFIAVEPQAPANTNALARMRLDALHGLAMPVQWVDPFVGYAMAVRYLRLARTQGEPLELACALAEHGFGRAFEGGDHEEAQALLAQARELAGPNPPPEIDVELAFREGSVATTQWDLKLARERLEHAQRVGTERCPDQPWLLTHVRTGLGSVLANLGEHAVLADLTTAWLAEARDRNDDFSRATLEGFGYGFYRHLMLDKPDRASQRIEEALTPWPAEPFSFAHFGRLIAHTLIEHYRGGDHALRWLEAERERLSRALLLRGGVALSTLRMLEASALLAAHEVASDARKDEIRKQVHKLVRQVRSAGSPFHDIVRLTIELQLAVVERDAPRAHDRIAKLRLLPGSVDNPLQSWGLELAEGVLAGGEHRERAQRAVYDKLAEQGWQKPAKAVTMLWPGLAQL
jgi:eukaryotic-like serine/threonine-protein kinase